MPARKPAQHCAWSAECQPLRAPGARALHIANKDTKMTVSSDKSKTLGSLVLPPCISARVGEPWPLKAAQVVARQLALGEWLQWIAAGNSDVCVLWVA